MAGNGGEKQWLEPFLAVGCRVVLFLLESKWGEKLDGFRQGGEE